MGMVMTLVIVVDEERRPRRDGGGPAGLPRAPRPGARRDPRRRARRSAAVNAQVGTGDGWSGETALIRLNGEVVKHPESVVLPLLLPDSPVVVWWPADAPDDPAARPARRARAAPDHRRRRRAPGGKARAIHTQCSAYSAGQHRPGLDPDHRRGGPCSPRRSTSTRCKVTGRRRSPPSGSARAPTCSSPGWPTGSR